MNIEIEPKSQRARNRVIEHGKVMELVQNYGNKVLVRSLECTWNSCSQKWLGWFTNEEASWKLLKDEVAL
jgi:hypothetical protein